MHLAASLLVDSRLWSYVSAAMMVWCLYDWWDNGGGDGMKRRLKAWAQAFGPRTAPQGA